MLKRTAAIGVLAMVALAASAPADLAYKKATTQNNKKGTWEAKSSYIQFKGSSPLVATANESMRKAARARFAVFVRDAREHAPYCPEYPRYYFDESPTVNLAKPTLVSVVATVETYDNGAHGYRYPVFDNWAVVSGKPKKLHLEDLLVRGKADVPAVSMLVIGKLAEIEHADWVQEGTVRELDKDTKDNFTITKKGLSYIFAPYVMGCYASGTIVVDLSWDELKGLVNPNGPLKPVISK